MRPPQSSCGQASKILAPNFLDGNGKSYVQRNRFLVSKLLRATGVLAVDLERIHNRLGEIAADRARGASELADAAACALAEAASAMGDVEAEAAAGQRFSALARAVAAARPDMAPFYHLAAAVLGSRDSADLRARAEDFRGRLGGGALAAWAGRRVEAGSQVITYSRSGSVITTLLAAHAAGVPFEVWVGESRPGCEGRSVAAALSEAGLRVGLFTDAALLSRVADSQLILLGADAVGRQGFLNKIGTWALCRAAMETQTHVLVLADETKFLPEALWPPRSDRPPAEVWADAPSAVIVHNPYFEVTPLSCADAVVTAAGELEVDEVAARVDRAAAELESLMQLLM